MKKLLIIALMGGLSTGITLASSGSGSGQTCVAPNDTWCEAGPGAPASGGGQYTQGSKCGSHTEWNDDGIVSYTACGNFTIVSNIQE